MNFIKLSLLFWMFFASAAHAQHCSSEQGNLLGRLTTQLNSLEKSFNDFIETSLKGFQNEKEREFLRNRIGALPALRSAACDSMVLSTTLCLPKTNPPQKIMAGMDDEMDAVRHFIWTVVIACSKGPRFAKEYTTIHEDVELNSEQQIQMDLDNNAKGIAWVEQNMQRCQIIWQHLKIRRRA